MHKGLVSTLYQGLRLGMLLQLAVGPICLLVLNTAAGGGFAAALPLIAAVTLADALYVMLACLGAAAVVNRKRVKAVVRVLGSVVLLAFGLDLVLGAFGLALLPGVRLFSADASGSLFIKGLLMTLSNPLTILFWSGMLSAKVAQNSWSKRELAVFALGCVLATVIFLTPAAYLASLAGGVLPPIIITVLNGLVGAALIFFGVKMALKRNDSIGLAEQK